jgi:hypothetical protein
MNTNDPKDPDMDGVDSPGDESPFQPFNLLGGGIVAPSIRLPNGEVIFLSDWIWGSLYSAAVVMPYGEGYDELCPFASGRSQQLAGAPAGEFATSSHSNIPRSGDNGLPNGWEMFVSGWRAQCSLPLEQPVVDFASDCFAEFQYNGKMYGQGRLIDLLLGASALAGEGGAPNLPIHMRPHLSYGVVLRPMKKAASDDFRAYLRTRTPCADPTVIAELEQLARLAGGNVGSEITRIQKKLQPGKRATFWIGIDGYIKRTVV